MNGILNLDQELFLVLNQLHHPTIDPVMVFLSEKLVWLPLYATLVVLLVLKFKSKSWAVILVLCITIALSDRLTSGLMKPEIGRLRPCHNAELSAAVHLVDGCGGKYGFPSSHAANTFALATFIWLAFGKNRFTILLLSWAALVSYSRIYLGVHFPLDVILGAIIGSILGLLTFKTLHRYCLKKIKF